MNRGDMSSYVQKDKIITNIKVSIAAIVSALVSLAANWLFDGHFVWAIIVTAFLVTFSIVIIIFLNVYEKRVSILAIMNNDISRKKYQEAAKLGYSVSRAFFLAGKNKERSNIAKKVIEALNKLNGRIMINRKTYDVEILKAHILIDDYAWSLYLTDRFNKKEDAEFNIKKGINSSVCLSLRKKKADTYYTTFKGLRHLFAMVIENFHKEPIEVLKFDRELLNDYKTKIEYYGGLLGYLIDEKIMYDTEKTQGYIDAFKNITLEAENYRSYLSDFRAWCIYEISEKHPLLFSTYMFRILYLTGLHKINVIENNISNSPKLLEYARDLSVEMTMGYANDPLDYEWLFEKGEYFDSTRKHLEFSCIQKDQERFVKGCYMIGFVAKEFDERNYLNFANKAYKKAISLCKDINRTDIYLDAQKDRILVKERLLNIDNKYNTKNARIEGLNELIKKVDSAKKECTDYLGHTDKETDKYFKEKKKQFRQQLSSLQKK